MSYQPCAECIRSRYLDQHHSPGGLDAELLSRMAADIAAQCQVTRFRAYRLARGWTIDQAVSAFHAMCRRENIKRGLKSRSWMEWESGARPSWDYQDLLSRLFQVSPVELGWATDYSPSGSGGPQVAAAIPTLAAAPMVATIQQAAPPDARRRSLLHLPPDIRDFTGRAQQVREVSQLITTAVASVMAVPPIVWVCGQGGTGKSALAIHVAHRVSGTFPDGPLYATLRRADAGAVDPADVLAGFLRALGVDGSDIPEGIDERARMYRAQLAGQRVLVVLDDAADEAQVRPLLPGSGRCAVLVTGRSRLAALAGSHSVAIGALPAEEAAAMLAAIIGADRAEAEPDAVATIARLCGYLPLAVRIAGARLVSRPAWTISWFASRLSDESRRLDLLKAGDLEVRASFALSYDSRPGDEQLAFRMLGLLPADFPAWALAAVLGTDEAEAERRLEQLADAALADIAGVDASGLIRYRLHDLLRAFAQELTHDAEDRDAVRGRISRLISEYTGAAQLAAALIHPSQGTTKPGPLLAGETVEGGPWGWLTAERVTLVERAHGASLWDQAWQLAEVLPALFDWRADWRSWERTHQLALDAARHAADLTARPRILRSLGTLYRELGRYVEADSLLTQALDLFSEHGSQHQRATTRRNLGDTWRYQGHLDDAIDAFTGAMSIFHAERDLRSVAGALNGLADAQRGLCRWDESSRNFQDCIAHYRDLGDTMEEARSKIRYALVFRDQHLSQSAIQLIKEGLETVRQLGDRRWEARAMRQLAIIARNDGDTSTAISTLASCLAIPVELEDRRGQAVVLRNRGDAHRLAGSLDAADSDLAAALIAFEDIGDDRWAARTRMSIAGLYRARQQWDDAEAHLDAARATFEDIGDRPADARAYREVGLLLRDAGHLERARHSLNASQEIFSELGDALWTARILASKAGLESLRGQDPEPLLQQARTLCRQRGLKGESIKKALREW